VAPRSQAPQLPQSLPNVNPTDIGVAGQTRVIVDAVKETVAELKADVRNIRDHRFTDMMWHIGALTAGVILLGGMMITLYFKIEDKIEAISNESTKVETKLEDLLQRVPPGEAPSTAPTRK
jgi:hypothetical protein